MCLIAFAIGASQRWPLVIAANRDEFLNRPALPLERWQTANGQHIISGRDLRAGGTWLGVTPGGRVAFLTNVREPAAAGLAAALRSRGELVTRWLEEHSDAEDFSQVLQADAHAYGGFNLVVGDFRRGAWTWLTNRSSRAALHTETLGPGVYGLSNAALDTPWPKTRQLKQVLKTTLQTGNESTPATALPDALWRALASRARARPEELPSTGVPLALEEALSSAFVELPERGYGTRCSTLLLAGAVDAGDSGDNPRSWDVLLEERTHPHLPLQELTAGQTPFVSRQAILWR